MIRAIAYLRVSSREQGQSGFGLQSQKAEIEAFAKAAGYRIMKTFTEVGSAIGDDSLERRPEAKAAIAHALRTKWPILVRDLDRLSREAKELEDIVSSGAVKVVSVRNGPYSDPVVLQTQVARISTETTLLKDRTRTGILGARLQGKLFGNRKNLPEAQRKGVLARQKKARTRAQELLPVIAEIRASGSTTGAAIAHALNQRGYRTSRGLEWTDANIRRILRGFPKPDPDPEDDDQNRQNPLWGIF